jgi:tetratricopeptide (TPR) repeat protein
MVTSLLAMALLGAFVIQNSNPSIQGETTLFSATGPLGRVQKEGSSIRVAFKWGRTTMRILAPDPELFDVLHAAREAGANITLRSHLEGAHFDQRTGMPVFWVESVAFRGKEYGPFAPRVPWSWRVMRDEQVALLRGIVLHGDEQYNAALTEFNRSLATEVLSPGQRGMALGARGDVYEFKAYVENAGPGRDFFFARAAEDYAAAAELLAGDYRMLLARGNMLVKLGAYDEALTAYDQSARRYTGGYYQIGIPVSTLLRRMGRYPEALIEMDLIADRDKDELGMMYYYHRGWSLLLLERHADAIESFTAGLKTQPDWPWAYVGRACASHALNDVGQAIEDLRHTGELFTRLRKNEPASNPATDAALHAELLNNVSALERQLSGRTAAANVTICQRFEPNFEEPLRTRSKLLDAV